MNDTNAKIKDNSEKKSAEEKLETFIETKEIIPGKSLYENNNNNEEKLKKALDNSILKLKLEEEETSSSSSSSSSEDENKDKIKKAIEFLKNPSINDISMEEKEEYLKTQKGYSTQEIKKAKKHLKKKKKRKKKHSSKRNNSVSSVKNPSPQYKNLPTDNNTALPPPSFHYRHLQDAEIEEQMAMSSTVITTSMGAGAFIAIVAMAGWRWLNGGDFQLIPPPHKSPAIDEDNEDNEEAQNLAEQAEREDHEFQQDNRSQSNSIIQEEYQEGEDDDYDPFQIISDKIDNLTTSVEKLLQAQSIEKHRTLTNSAIDLLRPQATSSTTNLTSSDSVSNQPLSNHSNQHDCTTDLHEKIQVIQQSNNITSLEYHDSIRMLYLYLNNLHQNPTTTRYRKIYTQSESFQSKIRTCKGATELLNYVGFSIDDSNKSWLEIKEDFDVDMQNLKQIIKDLSFLLGKNSNQKNSIVRATPPANE